MLPHWIERNHLKDYLVDDDKSTFSSSADNICAAATIMAGAFISDLEWSCQKLWKASIKVMWIYLRPVKFIKEPRFRLLFSKSVRLHHRAAFWEGSVGLAGQLWASPQSSLRGRAHGCLEAGPSLSFVGTAVSLACCELGSSSLALGAQEPCSVHCLQRWLNVKSEE